MVDRELILCGLILERLFWTGLIVGSGLSFAHVFRHALGCAVYRSGEQMYEHLCYLSGADVLFDLYVWGFFHDNRSDPHYRVCTEQLPFTLPLPHLLSVTN